MYDKCVLKKYYEVMVQNSVHNAKLYTEFFIVEVECLLLKNTLNNCRHVVNILLDIVNHFKKKLVVDINDCDLKKNI